MAGDYIVAGIHSKPTWFNKQTGHRSGPSVFSKLEDAAARSAGL